MFTRTCSFPPQVITLISLSDMEAGDKHGCILDTCDMNIYNNLQVCVYMQPHEAARGRVCLILDLSCISVQRQQPWTWIYFYTGRATPGSGKRKRERTWKGKKNGRVQMNALLASADYFSVCAFCLISFDKYIFWLEFWMIALLSEG